MVYKISTSTSSALYNDIRTGMARWNNVAMSTFTFINGDPTSESQYLYDGINLVNIDSAFCTHNSANCGQGILGFSGTWYSTNPYTAIESDIILNGEEFTWGDGTGGTENTIAVIAHEGGHNAGLTHPGSTCRASGSSGCGPEFESATMYWNYSYGQPTDKASLELDDVASLVYGYPRSTFRVRVLDQNSSPVSGAAVGLIGTAAPVNGSSISTGGSVRGDVTNTNVLFGDKVSSATYSTTSPFSDTDPDGYTNYINPCHQSFQVRVTYGGQTETQSVTVPDGASTTTVTLGGGSSVTDLSNGQGVHVSLLEGEKRYFRINVPSGMGSLEVALTGIIGDLDLYTQYNDLPTEATYDCRPYYLPNFDETCLHANPTAGYWYIMVHGSLDGTANLTATYTGSCVVPTAPGSISYTSPDINGNFMVSWGFSSEATGYTLQRATTSNFSDAQIVYSGAAINFYQTGLAAGTYYYRVNASNLCGTSDWKNGGAVVVGTPCVAPTAPASISYPSTDNDGSFTVSWSASSGATGYTLQRATTSDFLDAQTVYSGASTSYAQTDLANGMHYYRVNALNSCGTSAWKAGPSVTVCVPPTAPSILTYPTTDDDGSFRVAWTLSSRAFNYTLQRADNASFTGAVTVYSEASLTFDQTGLATGTYYYRVNASNFCGTSGWTAGPAIVVCIPPAAPGSITYPSGGSGSFTVSWGASSLATGYTLERAVNSSFTGATTAYSGPLTSYSQTGLNPGTYYFRVKARNNCGASAWTAGGAIRVVRNVVSALATTLLNDTDNDGIPDDVENRTCTDVNNADTDGDGIPDGVEDANRNGVLDSGETNPCDDDTDDDGLKDGVEDANRNGVLDTGETDPRTSDTDGDGLPDAWEVRYSLNPRVNDCNEDPDGDGFTNCQEYRWGTNPKDASSHPPKGIPWMNLILG